MEIGEEQQGPVKYPLRVDPAKRVRREDTPETEPVTAPAEEPVLVPARAMADLARAKRAGFDTTDWPLSVEASDG